jgi:hypothetical protein
MNGKVLCAYGIVSGLTGAVISMVSEQYSHLEASIFTALAIALLAVGAAID